MTEKTISFTIRKLPRPVHTALKVQAAQAQKPLEVLIREILTKAATGK